MPLRQTDLTIMEKLTAHSFYNEEHLSVIQIADAFNITFKKMRAMVKDGEWRRGKGYAKHVKAKRVATLKAIESEKRAIRENDDYVIMTQPELFEIEYQPREPWPSDQRFDAPGMAVKDSPFILDTHFSNLGFR